MGRDGGLYHMREAKRLIAGTARTSDAAGTVYRAGTLLSSTLRGVGDGGWRSVGQVMTPIEEQLGGEWTT